MFLLFLGFLFLPLFLPCTSSLHCIPFSMFLLSLSCLFIPCTSCLPYILFLMLLFFLLCLFTPCIRYIHFLPSILFLAFLYCLSNFTSSFFFNLQPGFSSACFFYFCGFSALIDKLLFTMSFL